ncbi:MAG: HAD hydrolase-like protein [Aliifodinibius sp.]|nr:HAD hydrolase-like protein [Fodinibius sp.]
MFFATRKAMENDDPLKTIKQTFDEHFYPRLGTSPNQMQESLLEFYTETYPSLSPIPAPDPAIVSFMDECLRNEYQLAIATNPIFPKIATYERLRWAGLPPEEYPYSLISTYENFHFTKPHPAYFMEMLAQIGWPNAQVIMIGNDLELDILPAQKIGLATYWVVNDETKKSCGNRHGAGPLQDFHSWMELQTEEDLMPDFSSYNSSLETFRTTPSALLTFLDDLSLNHWNHKPNNSSWSITEIICHLRDVDQEVHIPRIKLLRDNPSPFLAAIDADAWAEERGYHQQDGQEALMDFIAARKQLIELVSSLPKSVEKKEIRHTIFGPTSLNEIIRIAARHDRLHIQQVLSLQSTI